MWVYGGIMLSSFAMAMATIYTGHAELPWWALIVAIVLAIFLFPFVCIINAITGFSTEVQQLAQMLGAVVVPGNPQANMCTCGNTRSRASEPNIDLLILPCTDFTLYGVNACGQGIALARDLKLGKLYELQTMRESGF